MRRSVVLAGALAIAAIGAGALILDNRAGAARIDACVQRLPETMRQLEVARQQCQSLEKAGALRRAEAG